MSSIFDSLKNLFHKNYDKKLEKQKKEHNILKSALEEPVSRDHALEKENTSLIKEDLSLSKENINTPRINNNSVVEREEHLVNKDNNPNKNIYPESNINKKDYKNIYRSHIKNTGEIKFRKPKPFEDVSTIYKDENLESYNKKEINKEALDLNKDNKKSVKDTKKESKEERDKSFEFLNTKKEETKEVKNETINENNNLDKESREGLKYNTRNIDQKNTDLENNKGTEDSKKEVRESVEGKDFEFLRSKKENSNPEKEDLSNKVKDQYKKYENIERNIEKTNPDALKRINSFFSSKSDRKPNFAGLNRFKKNKIKNSFEFLNRKSNNDTKHTKDTNDTKDTKDTKEYNSEDKKTNNNTKFRKLKKFN
jgi:hypothetical protein